MATQAQTTSKVAPGDASQKPRAQMLIEHYNVEKGGRTNFESYWQSLHDYFYIESHNINRSYHPGTELDATYLWDSTTLETADVLASGWMNYLTPPTSKWFSLRPKNPLMQTNKKVLNYLEEVSDQVHYTLNKSNFYAQMQPAYKASGVYGTSAVMEEEDQEDDARFYTLPIKNVCLVEDGRGRVVEWFIEFEYTALQAADKWGAEKLTNEMQEELKPDNRKNTKHPFLLYLATRHKREIQKVDKKNMPIEATWIDVTGKIIVDEGGYQEMPSFAHRFNKRPFIPWGYSPAMLALPFARLLNAAAKTNMRAMMKGTDPAIAIPDNAFIMPFNGNPRGVNYYNKTKMDAKDIFEFGNKGNPQIGMTAVEYYGQKVKSLMYHDVFLAFDGITKQMNNPEVMEKINEKMTLLGPAVGREIAERLNPIVIRTIGILARRGKLPPPPDEIRMSPEYEIDITSQLAQSQRRSELNALVTGMQLVGQMSQFVPEVLHKIDADEAVDETWAIVGAPAKVLRDDDAVTEIRQAEAAAAAKQEQMADLQAGSEIVKAGSEVDKNMAMAGKGDK